MAKFCKNCGTGMQEGEKFCASCGAGIEAVPNTGQEQTGQGQYAPPPGQQQYMPPPGQQYAPGQQQGQPQYAQPGQQQYAQPQQPQYAQGQPQYAQPGQPQYAPQQPGQPQYAPGQQPQQGQYTQGRQPQYQYAQPVQTAPKQMNKKLLIIVIAAVAVALVLVFVLGGFGEKGDGGKDSVPPKDQGAGEVEDEINDEDEDMPTDEDADEDADGDAAQGAEYDPNQEVFDFTVLSGSGFLQGKWAINEVSGKFGAPSEVEGNYLPGYDVVYVHASFEGFHIDFAPLDASMFSFYGDGMEEKGYQLGKNDNDIKLDIVAIRYEKHNPDALLPNGIKIGKSTKAQIMDSYPQGAAKIYQDEGYGIDSVWYEYAFPDDKGRLPISGNNGHINYFFDNDEVLKYVEVFWYYIDL